MARGITQDQVNYAADALLRAGERPTIERVRMALGTGSPNTLIRLLDVWWAALGQRLTAQERRLALPEAPEAVAQAAAALWSMALEHAQDAATQALNAERDALAQARAGADRDVAQAHVAQAQALEAARGAEVTRDRALERLADMEQLVHQQRQQIDDLQAQRDRGYAERDEARAHAAALATDLQAVHTATTAERDRRDEQLRSVENRWLQEVDRARQEAARLHTQVALHERTLRAKEGDVETLRGQLAVAERETLSVRTRLDMATIENSRLHQVLADIHRRTPKRASGNAAAAHGGGTQTTPSSRIKANKRKRSEP